MAIHAAKGFPKWARETCETEPFSSALVSAGVRFTSPPPEHWYHAPAYRLDVKTVSLGAIVAVARLDAVYQTESIVWSWLKDIRGIDPPREQAFGDYAPGRYAWLLDDIKPLNEPIRCKGALGLWTVPDDIERLLR